jgi:D-glycero-beta-D-manno-heptose-7-phosphate kinase|tara:strand:+ start:5042 stop:5821 length:780 start_codon:yes stop_codon:yes gene_type:complete
MDTQQQRPSKILVIGDSCTDVYCFGSCERISPEAPVPVLKVLYSEEQPGMADNVAKNLESLGNEVLLFSNKEKIKKVRYVDNKTRQHLLRVDLGENSLLEPLPVQAVEKINFSAYDGVVLSDYNKGFLREKNIKTIIDLANRSQVPIFVDSKKNDLSAFENCFIKINEGEYNRAKNIPESSKLIVTLGSRGAMYSGDIYGVESAPVFDVCGAGDTFLAGLVTKYTLTKDVKKSIVYANKCATIAVKNFGTYVINKEEIK